MRAYTDTSEEKEAFLSPQKVFPGVDVMKLDIKLYVSSFVFQPTVLVKNNSPLLDISESIIFAKSNFKLYKPNNFLENTAILSSQLHFKQRQADSSQAVQAVEKTWIFKSEDEPQHTFKVTFLFRDEIERMKKDTEGEKKTSYTEYLLTDYVNDNHLGEGAKKMLGLTAQLFHNVKNEKKNLFKYLGGMAVGIGATFLTQKLFRKFFKRAKKAALVTNVEIYDVIATLQHVHTSIKKKNSDNTNELLASIQDSVRKLRNISETSEKVNSMIANGGLGKYKNKESSSVL